MVGFLRAFAAAAAAVPAAAAAAYAFSSSGPSTSRLRFPLPASSLSASASASSTSGRAPNAVAPMAAAATADLSAPDKVCSLARVVASNFVASPERSAACLTLCVVFWCVAVAGVGASGAHGRCTLTS
ncbi:hypothetical protein PVAP13_7KG294103 [Panicum virgatum]|uniref:Secreted protein n=1 Tax=Panicum virgatum TaxID=38727 RepID=A0A8T0QGD3_PANVG|nr:hypothetical protein PVAP13_7KG294103 [Panicum virgatum]